MSNKKLISKIYFKNTYNSIKKKSDQKMGRGPE